MTNQSAPLWVTMARFVQLTGVSRTEARRELKAGHLRGKRKGDALNSQTLIDLSSWNRRVESLPDWPGAAAE